MQSAQKKGAVAPNYRASLELAYVIFQLIIVYRTVHINSSYYSGKQGICPVPHSQLFKLVGINVF